MRRRIVSSVDPFFNEPANPAATSVASSKGMEAAVSLAVRLQTVALFPWVEVFKQGNPNENGMFYCHTPFREKLLDYIRRSTIISIQLKHGSLDCAEPDGPKDLYAVICEVLFKRKAKNVHTMWFYFRIRTGEQIGLKEQYY